MPAPEYDRSKDTSRPPVNSVGPKTAPVPSTFATPVNVTSGRKFGLVPNRSASRLDKKKNAAKARRAAQQA